MIYRVILDHTAIVALHEAHPVLSGLLVEASRGELELHVPAACLIAADAKRGGISAFAVDEPWLTVDPMTAEATAVMAPLLAEGLPLGTAHVIADAQTLDGFQGLLTMEPEEYERWAHLRARHPDRP